MNTSSKQLEEAACAFVKSLRMGEGFDEDRLEGLKAAVSGFHSEWASSDMLPKSGVLVLIDLPRMVEACAPLYHEPERQRIIDASCEIADVILEGFPQNGHDGAVE